MDHAERVVQQFAAQVDHFVHSPHVNAAQPVARFVAAVAPGPTDRALDVACGPGLLAKAFAPHVQEFVGVDLTPAMVERAVQLTHEAGLHNARFEVADAHHLPFDPSEFELVLSRLALHHMPDPQPVIHEMARVLKPGGRVGVFEIITSEIPDEANYHNHVERLRDPTHTRALPLSELVHLLGSAGLDVEVVDVVDYDLEVDGWIQRAWQSAEAAAEARRLLEQAVGTRRLGGRRVLLDDQGSLWFTVRWAIVAAMSRADRAHVIQ